MRSGLLKLTPITVLLAVSAPVIWLSTSDHREKPEYQKMRSYIVSRLSDEDIRQIMLEAEDESRRMVQARDEREREREESEAAMAVNCRDDVYRIRNSHSCSYGKLNLSGGLIMPSTSPAVIFEKKLMSLCSTSSTVAEAKKFKCLPE